MKQVVADTEYYGKSELLLDLKRPGCLGRPKQRWCGLSRPGLSKDTIYVVLEVRIVQ